MLIDDDNNILEEGVTSELPDIFHILTGSVIYKTYQDKEYKGRAEKLISECEEGKKFVSMECIFGNFDYALLNGDDYKVVARNENTSFLTKHLRAYGGDGKYENYRVGRLLRDIRFIAHGFVDKPANPNSIIFDRGEHFKFSSAKNIQNFQDSGVLLADTTKGCDVNNKEKIMAENILEKQVEELKANLKELTKERDDARAALSKADVQKFESEKQELVSKLEAKTKEVADKTAATDELAKKLSAAETERDNLKKEVAEVKAAQAKSNRVSILVAGGFEKTEAEAKVELFADLSDKQFDAIAETLVAAKKSAEKKDEKEEKKDDKKADASEKESKANVENAKNALENIPDAKEVEMNASASESENTVHKTIASWFDNVVGPKTKK
jgi:DNA repair exonuclease SbcCD ATPase subunit